MQAGFEIFLEFAVAIGALEQGGREQLSERSRRALSEVITRQAKYHQASDPAMRFLTLLDSGLWRGKAHVADRRGQAPEEPAAWGWRRKPSGRGWTPQGARIGWLAGADLYLDPAVSYQIAQQEAGQERLPVSEQTLRHRLQQRHLLASVDQGRQMLLVRRILEGRGRQVLHLKACDFVRRAG